MVQKYSNSPPNSSNAFWGRRESSLDFRPYIMDALMLRARRLGILVLGGALLTAGAAHCETLADAVDLAYQSNPTLQSERAQLRAIDETYTQARAAYGPSASVSVSHQYSQGDFSTFAGGQRLTRSSTPTRPC